MIRCGHVFACLSYHTFFLKVVDHYENPRNVGSLDKKDKNVGTGLVGAPACGDVMKLQVRFFFTLNFSIYIKHYLHLCCQPV